MNHRFRMNHRKAVQTCLRHSQMLLPEMLSDQKNTQDIPLEHVACPQIFLRISFRNPSMYSLELAFSSPKRFFLIWLDCVVL
jgi:hypothetical protein